jgi:hypothetical protein
MKKTFTLIFVLFAVTLINAHPPVPISGNTELPEAFVKHARMLNPDMTRQQRMTHQELRANLMRMHQAAITKNQKVVLDSIIEIVVDDADTKQAFYYDNKHRLVTMAFSEREAGSWLEDFRMEFTYYSNDMIESETMYDLNDDGVLEGFVRYVYTYDDNGNTIREDMYMFGEEGEWELFYQYVSTYDDNNRLLTETSTMHFAGITTDVEKTEYTYDSSGNNTMILYYASDFMGGWEPDTKEEYTYNAAGLITAGRYYEWDGETWIETERETYQYNGNLISEYISEYWDEEAEAWTNDDKEVYQYSGDKLILYTYLIWEEGQWMNDYKEELSYDSHDNMVRVIYSEWIEGAWQPVDKSDISYNTSQNAANLVFPGFWLGEGWGMITGYVFSEWVDGAWVVESEATFYWSGATTTSTGSVPDISITTFFPNPASEQITVGIDTNVNNLTINLFDMTGRNVMSKVIENHSSFPVNHLHKGIYLIVIQAENELFPAQKLVIR